MGTNAKTSHQSYAVAPSLAVAQPPAGAYHAPQPAALTDEQLPTATPVSGDELGVAHATESVDASDAAGPDHPGDVVEQLGNDPPALDGDHEQPVTPIPDTPEPGLAYGQAVLVGGGDLDSSTATLVTYIDQPGSRTVLHTVVNEESEAKLMAALHLSDTELVPVQVEQDVHGRLPIDETNKIADTLITAAKSVNFHLNQGDLTPGSIPTTTQTKLDQAQQLLLGITEQLGDSSLRSRQCWRTIRPNSRRSRQLPQTRPRSIRSRLTCTKAPPW